VRKSLVYGEQLQVVDVQVKFLLGPLAGNNLFQTMSPPTCCYAVLEDLDLPLTRVSGTTRLKDFWSRPPQS